MVPSASFIARVVFRVRGHGRSYPVTLVMAKLKAFFPSITNKVWKLVTMFGILLLFPEVRELGLVVIFFNRCSFARMGLQKT